MGARWRGPAGPSFVVRQDVLLVVLAVLTAILGAVAYAHGGWIAVAILVAVIVVSWYGAMADR